MEEQLLKAKQVQEKMNCFRAQVYQWIAEERLKSVKIGKMVRVRAEDLNSFIQEHSTYNKGGTMEKKILWYQFQDGTLKCFGKAFQYAGVGNELHCGQLFSGGHCCELLQRECLKRSDESDDLTGAL